MSGQRESAASCQVCGSPAGKHNYYGANVCISCRGFFRRSVQSQQYTVFQCPIRSGASTTNQSTPCSIDSKSRKSCKKCRFQKCLDCGMRTAWVLTEEERKTRLLRRNNKRLNGCTEGSMALASTMMNKSTMPASLHLQFTTEERRQVDKLTQLIYTFAYHRYYQMFGEDLRLFHAWLGSVYRGQPMSYSMLKKIEAIDVEAMVERGYTILDDVLDSEKCGTFHADLKECVQTSMTNIAYFYSFCESRDMDDFMQEFVSYGQHNPYMPGVEAVQQELARINVGGLKSEWNYNVMYRSPWAPSEDIEDRHFKMSSSICQWPRQETDNTIDKSQLVLLTMVLLLTTPPEFGGDCLISFQDETFRSYENVRMVEQKQMQYLLMLYRYLQDKYRNSTAATPKFANGVQIISKAREVYEMHQRMIPDRLPDEYVLFDMI